jgi:hypothetical protein
VTGAKELVVPKMVGGKVSCPPATGWAVLEATAGGVQINPLKNRNFNVFWVRGSDAQYVTVMQSLDKYIGAKYDFLGLIAFMWRKNYQDPNKWFCSELVYAILEAGGLPLLHNQLVKSWQVTPRLLLALLKGALSPATLLSLPKDGSLP